MKSETVAKLAEALNKAQAEMPAAKMNATNPFLHNKYADLGEIISTAKPVLAKNGLSVSQMVSGADGHVAVETMLMHSSGEWIASTLSMPMGEERGKSAAQVMGSLITYMRRYALSAIIGMYADEDEDGNGKQEQKPPAKPAAAKLAPVQKPVTMAAAGEQLAQGMPLEEAALVKNSEGTPYTEIDTAKLSHMLNAMTKGVRENKYAGEELDTVLYKIEAAKAIIASR